MAPAGQNQRRKEKSRKTSIKKRSMNLCKKAKELSILCGADLCLINYPPTGDSTAITWPKGRDEVERIVRRYLDLSPSKKKAGKHTTVKDFKPAAAPEAQAEAGPSSRRKSTEKLAALKDFKPAGKAAELSAGAEACSSSSSASSSSASKKHNVVEKYPLWLPCPDDRHELSALVDVLGAKLKEARERIAKLSAASSSETPENTSGVPVEAPEPISFACPWAHSSFQRTC